MRYPFSLITGQGLGTSHSSLAQIGELQPSRPLGQAKLQIIANMTTGNLSVQTNVVRMASVSGPLEFYWTYNSRSQKLTSLWHFSQDRRFLKFPDPQDPNDKTAILLEIDGHETTYTQNPVNKNYYFAPPLKSGTPYLLYDSENHYWVLRDPATHIVEYYYQNGLRFARTDEHGNLTRYTYDTGKRLIAISDPRGFHYEIGYAENYIAVILNQNGEPILLRKDFFNEQGQLLESVIGQNNFYTVTYNYFSTSNPALKSITQTDQTSMEFAYNLDSQNRPMLISIRVGGGNFLNTFDYSQALQSIFTFTDACGIHTKVMVDNELRVQQLFKEQGFDTVTTIDITYFSYTNGQLTTITHPDKAQEIFIYSGFYNFLTEYHGPNGQQIQYIYGIPGSGNQENRICRIQLLNTATGPVNVITRYVYNTQYQEYYRFLAFVLDSKGQVTQYEPTADGGIKSKRVYLNTHYAVENLPPNSSPSYSLIQAWVTQQQQNGQFQQVNLTEWDRNERGLAIEIRRYAHIDSSGQGVNDAEMGRTIYEWNNYGDWYYQKQRQSESINLEITREFDALRRLVSYQDPANYVTIHNYKDSAENVETLYPNGRKETTYWDSIGLTKKHEGLVTLPTTQYRLEKFSADVIGRTVMITPPDQQTTYRFLDRQWRLGFTVSTTGIIKQWIYSRQYRYRIQIEYEDRINPQKLFKVWPPTPNELPEAQYLIAILPINDPKKRVSYEFYNASKQLIYTVDADGYLIQYRYDTLKRHTGTFIYKDKISQENLNLLLQGESINLIPDVNKDSCTQIFYDENNQIIGTQDPDGYVIENRYDDGEQRIERIEYFNPSLVNLTASFNEILPTPSPKDGTHYYFYDARNQCIAEVDEGGYLTVHQYLAGGLLYRSMTYPDLVPESWYENTKNSPAAPTEIPPGTKITMYSYDALNRQSARYDIYDPAQPSNAKAAVDEFDSMGNHTVHREQDLAAILSLEPDQMRQERYQYDGWDQSSHYANSEVAAKLAAIDANNGLSPDQKRAAKEKVWNENSTRYLYDSSGLLLQKIDPLDHSTYYYYNSERWLSFIINAEGKITHLQRNSFKEIIEKRRYDQGLDLSKTPLSGGFLSDAFEQQLLLLQSEKDEITTLKRGFRGLVEGETDGEGYTTERTFNAKKLVETELLPIEGKTPTLLVTHDYNLRGAKTRLGRRAGEVSIEEQWQYENPYGKPSLYVNPLGGQYQTDYEQRGLIKEIINPLDIVPHRYQYNAFRQKITDTDANDNTTIFNYNRKERRLTVQYPITGSKEVTEHNIFNEPIVRATATGEQSGQVTLITHDSLGKIHSDTNPLDEITTDNYNEIGLHLQHQNPENIITAMNYDALGELEKMVDDTQDLKLTTLRKHDSFQQIREKTNANGIRSDYLFDRRGDWIGEQFDPDADLYSGMRLFTVNAYNGGRQRIKNMQGNFGDPNLWQEQDTYDGFNRRREQLIDPAGLALKTQYRRNAANLVIAKIDPQNFTTRYFYNNVPQKRVQVAATGQVIEWIYDKTNRLSAVQHYAKPLNASQLSQLTDSTTVTQVLAMCSASANDEIEHYFYDENGNLRFRVNAAGEVIDHRYNLNNWEQAQIRYSVRIPQQNLQQLDYAFLVQWADQNRNFTNQEIYYVLDEEGQRRFILYGNGVVIEQQFNKIKLRVARFIYATRIKNVADLKEKTVSEVEAVMQALREAQQDQRDFWLYDRVGRLQYQVNSDNEVTRFYYDRLHNQVRSCRFSTTITASYDPAQIQQEVNALDPDSKNNLSIIQLYNHANEKVVIRDAKGGVHYTFYDALGNPCVLIKPDGGVQVKFYDRARRLVRERDYVYRIDLEKVDSKKALTEILALCVPNDQEDTIQWYFHDNNGNVRFIGNNNDQVVEYRYNANNQLIQTLQYGDKIETAPLSQWNLQNMELWAGNHINSANSQDYKIRNGLGQVRFTTDGNGVITETCYDNAGREITIIIYRPRCADPATIIHKTPEEISEFLALNHYVAAEIRHKIYDAQGRLQYTIDAVGNVSLFEHDQQNNLIETCIFASSVPITSNYQSVLQAIAALKPETGNNEITQATYNSVNKVLSKEDAEGHLTRFYYDSAGRERFKVQILGPRAAVTEYQYDVFGRRHLARHYVNFLNSSNITNQTTTEQIVTLCQSIIDINDQCDFHLYDKNGNERFVVNHAGSVTEKRYDAASQEITSIDYVTQANPQDIANWTLSDAEAFAQAHQLEKNPTNYFIRDGKGQIRFEITPRGFIQQYERDSLGNVLIKVEYSAPLTATQIQTLLNTPWNQVAALIPKNPTQDRTTYQVMDAFNRVQYSVNTRNGVTQYFYDAVGNCLQQCQYKKAITDPTNYAALLSELEQLTPSAAIDRIHQYAYNETQEKIAVTNPLGNITRTFYDAQGRKRFEVDAKGGIKEWRYDAFGNKAQERIYQTAINPNQLNNQTTLDEIIALCQPIENVQDTVHWRFYDKNNYERFRVTNLGILKSNTAPVGSVQEKRYNEAGVCIAEVSYSTEINVQDMQNSNLTTMEEWASLHLADIGNRNTYDIIDGSGQKRFHIAADNRITEYDYDAAGNRLVKILYATPLSDPAEVAKLAPDQVFTQIINPQENRTTRWSYDALGRKQLTIYPADSLGNHSVTGYQYDEAGNKTQKCLYAKPISPSDNMTDAITRYAQTPANRQVDRVTDYTYNFANERTQITDPLNYTDRFERDKAGNITQHTDRKGAVTTYKYTIFNQLELTTAPAISVTPVNYDVNNQKLFEGQEISEAKQTYRDYDLAGNETALIDGYISAEDKIVPANKVVPGAKIPLESKIAVQEAADTPRELYSNYDACGHLEGTIQPNVEIDNPKAEANFSNLPVTKTTLTTNITYDAKGLKIIVIDANGHYTWLVYNAAQQLTYLVNQKGAITQLTRNAFGEIILKKRYFNPIEINSDYFKNGIPIQALEGALVPDSEKDRMDIFIRDNLGRKIQIVRNAVFYHLASPELKHPQEFGTASPTTNLIRNPYGQVIAHQRLWAPKLGAVTQTLNWYDGNGRCIATAKPVHGLSEKTPITPAYAVTLYSYNAFGDQVSEQQYAYAVSSLSFHTSYLELLNSLIKDPKKDRFYQYQRDLAGQLIAKIIESQVVQGFELVNGKPSIYDKNPQNLLQTFTYSPTGKLISTTHENGATEYTFYNARDQVIAETGVPREQLLQNGQRQIITPLTYKGVNTFGEPVKILRFKYGTQNVNPNQVPVPIQTSPDDQLELGRCDDRGLKIMQQDAETNLIVTTYTATRKVTRTFYYRSTVVAVSTKQEDKEKSEIANSRSKGKEKIDEDEIIFSADNAEKNAKKAGKKLSSASVTTTLHIDEKQISFDELDRALTMTQLRDNSEQYYTQNQYNVFNEVVAEGDHTGFYLFRHFDALGRVWKTNAESRISGPGSGPGNAGGVWTLLLYDLRQQLSAKIQSATKELDSFDYSTLETFVSTQLYTDILYYEAMQTVRDASGRALVKGTPGYNEADFQAGKNIPVVMTIGNNYTEFGVPSVSFSNPQLSSVHSVKFQLMPYAQSGPTQEIPLQQYSDRWGFNYSALTTDHYNYRIDYYIIDPITEDNQKLILAYRTEGELQIVTNQTSNSQFVTVEVFDNNQIRLSGNTAGIFAVDLYQGPKKIPKIPVNPSTLTADLSQQISGEYRLVPIFSDNKTIPRSIAFTIFTNQPSPSPLSRQFTIDNVTLAMKSGSKEAEINWQVEWPLPYQQAAIQVEVEYRDRQNHVITKTAILTQQKNIVYFEQEEEHIISLSLALQLTATEWVPIYVKEKPTGEDSHHVYSFPTRDVTYVFPWTGLTAPPEISYLDTSLDQQQQWKTMTALAVTAQGFVLNVTAFSCGAYPFQIVNDTMASTFVVTDGGVVYPSEPVAAWDKDLRWPAIIFQYDRWNNRTQMIDADNHQTNYDFNFQNKLSKKIDPVVNIMPPNNSKPILGRPTTGHGHNECAVFIGTIDANAQFDPERCHTTGIDVNAAGQEVVAWSAKGIAMRQQSVNALNQVEWYWDAAIHLWVQLWNRNNQVTSLISPLQNQWQFGYDETGHRNALTDPAQNTWWNNYGINNDIIAGITPPTPQNKPPQPALTTTYAWDHNHRLTQQVLPDSVHQLIYYRDYFGYEQTHSDLCQTHYTSSYDNKMQLTSRGSSETFNPALGSHGTDVDFIPDYQNGEIVGFHTGKPYEVPLQKLKFIYFAGRLATITDDSESSQRFKRVDYGYNRGGYRSDVTYHVYNPLFPQGVLIRILHTDYDGLYRSNFSFDTWMYQYSNYDAVGNIRNTISKLFDDSGKLITVKALWNTFSETNKVLVDEGELDKEGKIVLVPGQGNEYSYNSADRRATQTNIDSHHQKFTSKIEWDQDARLKRVAYNEGNDRAQESDWAYYESSENLKKSDYGFIGPRWNSKGEYFLIETRSDIFYYQTDGFVETISQNTSININFLNNTNTGALVNYGRDPVSGLVNKQDTGYRVRHDDGHTQEFYDYLNYKYVYFDDVETDEISGRRSSPGGEGPYTSTRVYRNANAVITTVIGADTKNNYNENQDFSGNLHLIIPPDGLPLMKIYVAGKSNDGFLPFGNQSEWFALREFYRADGSVMGSSKGPLTLAPSSSTAAKDAFEAIFDYTRFGESDFGGFRLKVASKSILSEMLEMLGIEKQLRRQMAQNFKITDVVQPISRNYPPLTTPVESIQADQTLGGLALEAYGDGGVASSVALANGLWQDSSVQIGQFVRMPEFIESHESAAVHEPYEQLMQQMIGSLQPYLITKQPHESWWQELIGIVVMVVIAIVAPEIAAALLPSAGIMLYISSAVVGALMDMATQELLIGLHLEKKFSWTQVLQAAFTAAAGAKAMSLKGAPVTGKAIEVAMLEEGAIATTEQLLELSLGLTHHFNLAAIATSILTEGADLELAGEFTALAKIKVIGWALSDLDEGFVNEVIGSVVGNQPFSIEDVALSALGEEIGQEIAPEVASGVIDVGEEVEEGVDRLEINEVENELTQVRQELIHTNNVEQWENLMDDESALEEEAVDLETHVLRLQFGISHIEVQKQVQRAQGHQQLKQQFPIGYQRIMMRLPAAEAINAARSTLQQNSYLQKTATTTSFTNTNTGAINAARSALSTTAPSVGAAPSAMNAGVLSTATNATPINVGVTTSAIIAARAALQQTPTNFAEIATENEANVAAETARALPTKITSSIVMYRAWRASELDLQRGWQTLEEVWSHQQSVLNPIESENHPTWVNVAAAAINDANINGNSTALTSWWSWSALTKPNAPSLWSLTIEGTQEAADHLIDQTIPYFLYSHQGSGWDQALIATMYGFNYFMTKTTMGQGLTLDAYAAQEFFAEHPLITEGLQALQLADVLGGGLETAAPILETALTKSSAWVSRVALFGRQANTFSGEASFAAERLLSPEEQLQEALNDSKVYQQLRDIDITSPNSASALRAKLSVLSNVQAKAESSEMLSNGRIRYYTKFRAARTPGPTSGARLITEYDPKTGDVMQWNETYDQQGLVNRIHLKNINGIQINSPHFPPTLQEVLEEELSSPYILGSGY